MALCMTHTYFDKGLLLKAVISGTHQLKSMSKYDIFNASVAILYFMLGFLAMTLEAVVTGHICSEERPGSGAEHKGAQRPLPSPALLSRRSLGGIAVALRTQCSWVIRVSRSLSPSSSIQRKHIRCFTSAWHIGCQAFCHAQSKNTQGKHVSYKRPTG